ncbi:DarT1-associated NADAR antitoxin family protein [Acinetobacter radioresistens]|uniref:DarT1-associated NADAR antitoxin family protein n=1 Tax=Acinetobacter radioresistens TaxID=40216 RepID=UPI003212F8AD
MATRPVFIPIFESDSLIKKDNIDFQYYSGFSVSQKQKTIASLHEAIYEKYGFKNILEVSSKSQDQLGIDLSAFNLMMFDKKSNKKFSVECAFQSSKVFEHGGPFIDLLDRTSREAKKDQRLKESGELLKFVFYGREWDLLPRTAFYDWLYINALNANPQYHEELSQYEAFTDIEFNPEKSINCQANSIAMFLSLKQKGLLDQVKNQETFLKLHKIYQSQKKYPTIDDKSQIGMRF